MQHGELNPDIIRDLAARERVSFKKHTLLRMHQRKISVDEIKAALCECEVVESYPKDRPLPSALLLGFTKARRPIHAVLAINEEDEMLWVITVYEPTLVEWRDGFKERRVENDMSTM